MRGLRVAASWVGMRARQPRTWLALLAVAALGPWVRWMWARPFGPWLTEGPAPSILGVGLLIGLYCGCNDASSASFLAVRLNSLGRVSLRGALLAVNVGALGAIAVLGDGWGTAPVAAGASTWLEWAWSAALLTVLACALQSWFATGRRCFVAAVALVWWIPAVLPPSFLFAVPRALRDVFEGGRAIALPSEPAGWMSDTALAAGLLLLAWAPRRAILRGDEVRHPG
jgi:hypothetical protein